MSFEQNQQSGSFMEMFGQSGIFSFDGRISSERDLKKSTRKRLAFALTDRQMMITLSFSTHTQTFIQNLPHFANQQTDNVKKRQFLTPQKKNANNS